MRLIRGLHNIRPHHKRCVATVGNFDGVHLGHQMLIEQLKQHAQVLKVPACVIVFEPQPKEFFQQDKAPIRIMALREKMAALGHHGVDQLLVIPFNQRISRLSADQFIREILVNKLSIQHLVVGDDFRFGCERGGDFGYLQSVAQNYQFGVSESDTLSICHQRVSSTGLRQLLLQGDCAGVQRQLGRFYPLSGRVVLGRRLGRTLGVPTANVALPYRKPPFLGVFAVKAKLPQGRLVWGVANLGSRPTVGGGAPVLEVHLLDVNLNLYGQRIEVEFVAKIRDEQAFDSLLSLKQAISQDISRARAILSTGI